MYSTINISWLSLIVLVLSRLSPSACAPAKYAGCKLLPEDWNWPTRHEWNQLNITLNGALLSSIPLGSPCHGPSFNDAECAVLKNKWNDPQI
jgi:hypothetical protein